MVTTAVYSAIYGGYDVAAPQSVPVRMFTEQCRPLPRFPDPRQAAKWWKAFPELACPDAEVTIWIDGRMQVRVPDLAERCLEALGDDDALFVRHPFWDDIYRDAAESRHWTKYDGQPLEHQVETYRSMGHPSHWGLMHGGFLVRRDNARTRALSRAWWAEMDRWSLQDQLSLAELLRTTTELRYRWWDQSPLDTNPGDAGWVHWGHHRLPEGWRS